MKSALFYLIPLLALAAGAGTYYYKSQSAAEAKGKGGWGGGATPVIVSEAKEQRFVDTIEALGTIVANESATLSPKVTEIIRSIHFTEGQSITQGTLLVHLESGEEEALLREAQAVLEEAQSQLTRAQQLETTGGISQSALDEARSSYAAASAKADSLNSQIRDRQIVAPFDGVLGLRNVSVGSLVRPGDSVVAVMDISKVKLDFTLPEAALSLLKIGQTIQTSSIAYPGRIFEGTVKTIDSELDPITRAVTVRAELANPDQALLPGMLMTVELATIEKTSIAIPESALVPVGGQNYVFVVNQENIAQRILVTLGNRLPGTVEIIEGLQVGDIVITEGFRARHGKPVEIKENTSLQLTKAKSQ